MPRVCAFLVVLVLAAPAAASTVVVRVGSRLIFTEIAVDLPDGSRRTLAAGQSLHLPTGSRVTFAEGETRPYVGELRVRSGDGTSEAWLELPLDAYVAGAVLSEMGADAPPAALEAQAIVSRTLAAVGRDRHPEGPWPLCDLTHCQSFRGVPADGPVWEAVRATAGQILTVAGEVVEAPFHSTCGGRTLAAWEVWGGEPSHLEGVLDLRPDGTPWCSDSPHGPWTAAVAAADLPDPRLDGERFRTEVGRRHGWNLVKSNAFEVVELAWEGQPIWLLEGRGLGHGVGLCQRGAIARAREGAAAAEILRAYFPGATLGAAPEALR
jgi:stage II sporulation protein D